MSEKPPEGAPEGRGPHRLDLDKAVAARRGEAAEEPEAEREETPEVPAPSSEGDEAQAPVEPRLDPDEAVAALRDRLAKRPPPPAIDTRPYRWAIGIFGVVLVIVISVIQFLDHGVKSTGIAPGQHLNYFAAPLATTNLQGDANMHPPCTLAKHDPRALNVCLITHREPLVLAFFVTGSTDCKSEVDTMQTVSKQFPANKVAFAAVAVGTSHSDALSTIRKHGWTIPVAYDADDAVGEIYGVQFCPMVELAYRGGIVKDRLIGDNWLKPAALAREVRALLQSSPPPTKR